MWLWFTPITPKRTCPLDILPPSAWRHSSASDRGRPCIAHDPLLSPLYARVGSLPGGYAGGCAAQYRAGPGSRPPNWCVARGAPRLAHSGVAALRKSGLQNARLLSHVGPRRETMRALGGLPLEPVGYPDELRLLLPPH